MKTTFIKIKIFLITTCLISTIWSCKAQTNIVNIIERCDSHPLNRDNGSLYLKDINNLYAPYLGTWKWTEGNREFTLTLLKQTKYHYNQGIDNYYEDRIVGYYTYKENGVELINTSNDNLIDSYNIKVDYRFNCRSKLSGLIKDIAKNKRYLSWFEIISPTQIRFKGKEEEDGRIQKEGMPPPPVVYVGNSFPLDMVLTKQ
ncbi:hypothetical protein LXD69_06280 [Flavobacterium sediminilitoris]|uniref:DUF6705 domain-containing protein n=1 Tax=Flavobacterium sediminilitoris TaxID=2024526 RepID=A0ABY4HSD7_9FLAO|nr:MULTISPECIES: DUF6705 family protein [Flavobacterium]UOX35116.1 hypothetical protein LXD69_06280 [Flavobacterium sediminilitoris]